MTMDTSMRRILATIAGVLMILASGLTAPSAAATTTHPPRVVVVVGPVGPLTDSYRAAGQAAAREAARWTSDVVTIASPNATWPKVKAALQGASIVVYLGHGNGFPSPYRSDPYARTQNGLGLNPVAGGDDSAHQYFGESFLASQVRLAPGAIVVLSRLCYASGNSEPGGPEPTVAVAGQRADNYAAGWIAAGAQAVVADALAPPADYIRRLFSTGQAVESLWRTAKTYHDNVIALPSARTPGATVLLDPTKPDRSFYRSLVQVAGAGSVHVGRAATTSRVAPRAVVPVIPSLVALKIGTGQPELAPAGSTGGLVAGLKARFTLPLDVPSGTVLPSPLRLGMRWQSLDPQSTHYWLSSSAEGSPVQPAAEPPAIEGPAIEAPAIELVAAEQSGTVVASSPAVSSDSGLSMTVQLPAEPGRYRLTTTLLDADDVAFDAPTQALLPTLVVQVSRPASVAYGIATQATVEAGATFQLPIRVANNGSLPWAEPPTTLDPLTGHGQDNPAPVIAVRWLPLDAQPVVTDFVATTAPRLGPGEEAVVDLLLTAPRDAGSYLLLIDVISPIHGSLAAAGGSFAETRITVRPAVEKVRWMHGR